MRKQLCILAIVCAMMGGQILPARVLAQEGEKKVFLPFIKSNSNPPENKPAVNLPYIPVTDVTKEKFREMAIFWFGEVRQDTNYTDVRVAYNDEAVFVYTSTFDKRVWYKEKSNGSDLENWDTVALMLHLDGSSQAPLPTRQSFRFVSQFRHWEEPDNYHHSYRGDGTRWVSQSVSFADDAGWRGGGLNDNTENEKGWTMAYKIPFTSLGLPGKPSDGTLWRMAVTMYDRDNPTGSMTETQRWPDGNNENSPASWGSIRFGLPSYNPPAVSDVQVTAIRHKLNGAVVPDAAVGGGMTCGSGIDHWSDWGEENYAHQENFNIQNQKDVSDWPCFSKYYVTFPLNLIPPGKAIRSARLVMHEFGGSDPSQAKASVIQVMRVTQDWDEATLSWNNAPQVLENVSRAWVQPFGTKKIVWPGDRYEWDVSRAVAQAYQEGVPLRLALYSADSAMHSGKYFVSSDTGDWNAEGRPTLIVEWGIP